MSHAPPHTRLRSSAPIRRKLARTRWTLVAMEVLRRSWWTLAVAVLLFGALLAADLIFELDAAIRRTGLIITALVAGGMAIWTLAAFATARRSDEDIALMVEREFPEFDSRLISAVQFARPGSDISPGAPEEMAEAALAEAEQASRRTPFLSVFDPRHCARAALALLGVVGAFSVWGMVERDTLPVLIARAFGGEVALPRETRIIEAPAESLIGIGDRLELAFTAEGILPQQGQLVIRYASGRREKAPLLADENASGRYLAAIDDVPESFTFRAEINDANTDEIAITALERPEVVSLGATQTYPAFTGLAPTEHAPGDFALLPGGELAIELTANKALSAGRLTFVGTGQEIPFAIDAERGSATFVIPEEPLGGFMIALVDNEGLETKDDSVYRVTQIVDRAPEIRITYPRRAEELVTRRARVLLRYSATDRFGVSAITLRYRRDGDESEPGSLPVGIPAGTPKVIDGELEWDLTALQPPAAEGESIDYWLEARDQNTAADRIGSTEILRLKVVSADEKRADLLGRASDTLGGVSETTDDQQQLNNALESLIRDAAGR